MTTAEKLAELRSLRAQALAAISAILVSQEYRMGTRHQRRVELRQARELLKYCDDEIAKLEGKPRINVKQIIPRDM